MATFNGTLNSNEIFASLFNMIISQQVFADNISGLSSSLVDKARVDGSMYGDTKLYYATDVLKSIDWIQDSAAATNVLELHRPKAPDVQAIEIDNFRQIALTVDEYMSKRAWSNEGAFSQFNSQMLGWLRDTKKVYDVTTYNTFIGTTEATAGKQTQTVELSTLIPAAVVGEERNRLEAMYIGQKIADIFLEMKDVSRDYNDFGNMRAFSESDMMIVWNGAYVNKIRYVDLPTVFHKDGILMKFEEEVLNPRYFGTPTLAATAKSANDGSFRTLVEADYATGVGAVVSHLFPGDVIPTGTVKVTSLNKGAVQGTYVAATVEGDANAIPAGEAYTVDEDVICKIIYKKSVPYMSAFEVGTSFFNDRNLSTNHYLTFGHNTLEYLMNYPFVTVHED